MPAYFDIIKFIFFLLTIIITLFQLRIKWVISSNVVNIIGPFVLPFYFILIWLIIGYIIGYLKSIKTTNDDKDHKSYIFWFIVGWIIWVILSGVYYFIIKS